MNFSEKLEALMARRGFNQPKLAEAIGTHQPQVSKWLREGVIPTIPLALRIAHVLGVSLDYLLDDALEVPPPASDWTEDEVFLVKTIRALRIDRDEAFKRLLAGGFGGLEIGAGAALPLHPAPDPAPAPAPTAPPAAEPLGTGRVIGEREHPRREPGGSPVDVEGQGERPDPPARPRRPRR